jgi:sugar phosphate isomerase/epimerase
MADSNSMRSIGGLCRSCGIEIIAYHAYKTDFSDLDSEEKRRRRVDHCRRQIDTMLDLGGVVWGSHAREANPTLVRCYKELARHVENTTALISVENFPRPGLSVADRMMFLNEIDHPQVGLILDIGHVRHPDGKNPMTVLGGPTEVVEACADRLFHVHLHGFKNNRDHFAPFVEGDGIQWVELFRILCAKGYSGYMNFEPLGNPTVHDALLAVAGVPEQIVKLNAQLT